MCLLLPVIVAVIVFKIWLIITIVNYLQERRNIDKERLDWDRRRYWKEERAQREEEYARREEERARREEPAWVIPVNPPPAPGRTIAFTCPTCKKAFSVPE